MWRIEIGQRIAIGVRQRDVSRLILAFAQTLFVGEKEVFVAVQALVGLGIHHGSLQVKLKDFGTCGCQQLSVDFVEVQVREERVGIVLQDVGPRVF